MATAQPGMGANQDPFDILDPATVAAQEQMAQDQGQYNRNFAEVQLTPQQQIALAMRGGAGQAWKAANQAWGGPGGQSPAVQRAKDLQEILVSAKDITDPIKQREFMAQRMAEKGHLSEAAKLQEQADKMKKATADISKTEAETKNLQGLEEKDLRIALARDGYKPEQIDAAVAARKAGNPNWMSGLKDKHSDTTWSDPYTMTIPGPNGGPGKAVLVHKALTGPDKGKIMQINSATEITNNNSATAQGGNAVMSPAQGNQEGVQTFIKMLDQYKDGTKSVAENEEALRQARQAQQALAKNPSNSTAKEALLSSLRRVATSTGAGSVGETKGIAGAGSVANTAGQFIRDILGAGLTPTKAREISQFLNSVEGNIKKHKQAVAQNYHKAGRMLGLSGAVMSPFLNAAGLPDAPEDTDPVRPEQQSPVSQGRIQSDRQATIQPAPAVQIKESRDPKGRRVFTSE